MMTVVVVIIVMTSLIKKQKIPKKIWSFWHTEEQPEFIRKCIRTWKEKNPDYEIHVLSEQTISNYLGKYETEQIKNWKYNDSKQRLSDLVRLSLLSKYGGIWLDASIVCYESFDWIYSFDDETCILFSIPQFSTIDSWFIACTPNNKFIKRVNEEFRNVKSMEDYEEYLHNSLRHNINYLLIYAVLRNVYDKYEHKNDIKLLDSSEGPLGFHKLPGKLLDPEFKKPKFLKLVQEDRRYMTEEIENVIFSQHCSS